MRKKKLAAGMVSVMLAGVMVMPVLAEEPTESVEVTYSQASTYTLSIPDKITLSPGEESVPVRIGASAVNMAPGRGLCIRIAGGLTEEGKIELKRTLDESGAKIVSDVTYSDTGHPVHINDSLILYTGTDETPYIELNFSKVQDGTDPAAEIKAGEYTGTVVFKGTVEIVPF